VISPFGGNSPVDFASISSKEASTDPDTRPLFKAVPIEALDCSEAQVNTFQRRALSGAEDVVLFTRI
jgi:hypothetical protein